MGLHLTRGIVTSCGCLQQKLRSERAHLTYVSGTMIEQLSRSAPITNTTGYIGVTKHKRSGKYYAQIGFRGKTYYLGSFASLEKAYQARVEAQEIIYDGFKNVYANWQIHSEDDSEWAAKNPFVFEVTKVNGEFQVITNEEQV